MRGNDQAFPVAATTEHSWVTGLTKRELFAAMMLQGILSRGVPVVDPPITGAAQMATDYADALIIALGGNKP